METEIGYINGMNLGIGFNRQLMIFIHHLL